jgi:hypothetical protein
MSSDQQAAENPAETAAETAEQYPAHHPTLAPSSWPAIIRCGAYRSGSGASKDSDRGSDLHDRAMRFAAGEITLTDGDPDDQAVEWVVRAAARAMGISLADLRRYIVDGTLLRECRVQIFRDFRRISFGSPDLHGMIAGTLFIVDYKFGHAAMPCLEQLAAYALGCMDIYDTDIAVVWPIYAATHKAERIVLSRAECEEIADRVQLMRATGEKQRNPWCHYCADYTTCDQWTTRVQALPVPLSGLSLPDALQVLSGDPAELTEDNAVLVSALDLWLRYAQKWIKTAHERTKAFVIAADAAGREVPGVLISQEQPRAKVSDVDLVFKRSGLAPADFVRVCKVSLSDLAKAMTVESVSTAYIVAGKELPFDCVGAQGKLLKSKMSAALRALMSDALEVGKPVTKIKRTDMSEENEDA